MRFSSKFKIIHRCYSFAHTVPSHVLCLPKRYKHMDVWWGRQSGTHSRRLALFPMFECTSRVYVYNFDHPMDWTESVCSSGSDIAIQITICRIARDLWHKKLAAAQWHHNILVQFSLCHKCLRHFSSKRCRLLRNRDKHIFRKCR